MVKPYLLPEDVSAEHATQVLDFLNQAASAQEIAEAVELPDVRDVGLRVAQRLLDRRAELNGFRTLDQVYAVPYVGPERFTEIVVSLSGARPPRTSTPVASMELAELRRSLDHMRALVAPAVEVRMWTVQDAIWLGQRATVLVQVNDVDGRPLVDQPVTVMATWGDLVPLHVIDATAGPTASVRTSDAGIAELHLQPRFQTLSEAQRLALEIAAGDLPLAAPWPTAAAKELRHLVQRYRAPGSDDLRDAIDATYHEYGAGVKQPQQRGHALAQWALVPVTLVCFVHDDRDDRGARHLGLAAHTLHVRNWLPALLAAFEDEVADDRRLTAELKRTPRDRATATAYLNDVFISVHSYLNTERGVLGQAVRMRAAQQELQQFLQTNVAGLPEDTRLAVLTGVRDASKTIGEGGLPLFRAVESTRLDGRKLDFDASAFDGRLLVLERTAVTTPQIDRLRTELLEQARADVNRSLQDMRTTFDAQVRALTATNATLSRQVETLTASTTSLRTDVTGLSSSINGLNTRITRDLAAVRERLTGLDARIDRLRP